MNEEIVVMWIDEEGAKFKACDTLIQALVESKMLRDLGLCHISISTNFKNDVTLKGVDDVKPGYDWRKRR